jgi:hypothetical protein
MENKIETTKRKQDIGQSDLEWLASKAREIKFGTIAGLVIRDGVVSKGPECRSERTGKPYCRNQSEKLADVNVLKKAINDLTKEAGELKGICTLKVKVSNGTIITWQIEEIESSIIYRSN